MLLGLFAALAVIIIDQISKYYVMADLLSGRGIIMVTDYFNIVRAWNTGVSFSMFNDMGSAGIVILSLVAAAIVGGLLVWLYKEKSRALQLALGMIIGGAVGNVIDRVRLGAVFDFLDFHVAGSHWPAFNAADSFICIGAAIIIVHSMIYHKNEKKAEEK